MKAAVVIALAKVILAGAGTELKPVAVIKTGFNEPTHNIETNYEAASSVGKPIDAKAYIKTILPTIRLDDYKEITSVICSPTSVTAVFQSAESKKAAYDAWSTKEEIGLIVNSCSSSNLATFVSKKLTSSDERTLKFEAKAIPASELYEDLELTLVRGESAISKRAFDYVTEGQSDESFDINYDIYNLRPVRNEIVLLDNKSYRAVCKNCFNVGEINSVSTFTMKFLKVKKYEIKVFGGARGNMDLEINKFGKEKIKDSAFISTDYLESITIPGLFSIQPELQLKTEISMKAEPVNVTVGFDYDFPFNYTFTGEGINDVKSEGVGIPSINEHQLVASREILSQTTIKFIPSFRFSFTAFNQPIFGYYLGFENNVEFYHRSRGLLDSSCPPNGLEYEMLAQSSSIFQITIGNRPPVTVYDSGKEARKCSFCSKCVLPEGESPQEEQAPQESLAPQEEQ
jgi:hypothetical protein